MEAWDAHVYFDGEDAASVEEALTLRYEVITSFPSLTVNRTRLSDPRGPWRTLTRLGAAWAGAALRALQSAARAPHDGDVFCGAAHPRTYPLRHLL